MNIIPDEEKLIGKTIVYAEIGGYGIRLKFSDGSILDYGSSSDGDSCWEIIDDTKQTEVEKLKPCPFCGSKAIINHKEALEAYICECSNDDCPASYMIGNIYDTREEAIEAWNRRVNDGD